MDLPEAIQWLPFLKSTVESCFLRQKSNLSLIRSLTGFPLKHHQQYLLSALLMYSCETEKNVQNKKKIKTCHWVKTWQVICGFYYWTSYHLFFWKILFILTKHQLLLQNASRVILKIVFLAMTWTCFFIHLSSAWIRKCSRKCRQLKEDNRCVRRQILL